MANKRWAILAVLVFGSFGHIAAPTAGSAGEEIRLAQSSSPPLEEVAIVYHSITWTFEPSGATSKNAVLAKAEDCMRQPSREDGEACLRKNGWQPASR
jgi:hypothetical protein